MHVPKTAGTSIGNTLTLVMPFFGYGKKSPAGTSKHQHALDLMELQKSEDYFKFAFVRNPWDRYVSSYFHTRNKNMKFFNDLSFKDYATWSQAWQAETVRRDNSLIERKRRGKHVFQGMGKFNISKKFKYSGRLEELRKEHKIYLQVSWITDRNGKNLMDFVGRFENLQEDFDYVCDRIGIKRKKLPHSNKSKRKRDYRKYYDDETKRVVAEKFTEDIEHFGYEF